MTMAERSLLDELEEVLDQPSVGPATEEVRFRADDLATRDAPVVSGLITVGDEWAELRLAAPQSAHALRPGGPECYCGKSR